MCFNNFSRSSKRALLVKVHPQMVVPLRLRDLALTAREPHHFDGRTSAPSFFVLIVKYKSIFKEFGLVKLSSFYVFVFSMLCFAFPYRLNFFPITNSTLVNT